MEYLTKDFFKTVAGFLLIIIVSIYIIIWVQEREDTTLDADLLVGDTYISDN